MCIHTLVESKPSAPDRLPGGPAATLGVHPTAERGQRLNGPCRTGSLCGRRTLVGGHVKQVPFGVTEHLVARGWCLLTQDCHGVRTGRAGVFPQLQ